MQLWVGLGNPGAQYALNRHNAGFMALDSIADVYGFEVPKQRLKGWVQEGHIVDEKILLLKPATFMNLSGESIRTAMDFYKLERGAVTVFHDELDLDPFRVRVKTGGGTAGHNGLKSAAAHIGPDFRRVRLGIGHPGAKDRVHDYVLGNYTKNEIEPLADMLGAVAAEAGWLSQGNDARFMSEVVARLAE